MSPKEEIKELINKHQRRLQKLREQQAVRGLNTPPEVSIEIEDIQIKIASLQAKLKKIDGEAEFLPEPNGSTSPDLPPKPEKDPFIHVRPVPATHFVGRTQEVAQILGQLANPARSCSAISGDPRVGKTSLLHYLHEKLAERQVWGLSPNWCHFLYLDCHNIVPFSEAAFWRLVLRELEQYVGDNELLKGDIRSLLAQTEPDSYDLNSLFDRIARAGRLVVLMLDEFEWVIKNLDPNAPGLLYHLRALLNRTERGLALLIASREPLEKLCAHFDFAGSPFNNCFVAITLPPFNKADVNELFFQYQIDLVSDERAYLDRIAGTHPYLVQLTASLIIQARNGQIGVEIRQSLIEVDLEHKAESHFLNLFNYSSEPEQMLLALLALYPLSQYLPPNQAKLEKPGRVFGRYEPELLHLTRRGLVLNQPDGPVLFSPVFVRWILRKVIIEKGSEMLSLWESSYTHHLPMAQKEILQNLVDKLGQWPEVVRKPELLAQAYEQDEVDLPFISVGNQVLGRYVIEESIGGGGMADVFKARHLGLDRVVAIKKLRPTLSETEEFRSRFQQEAQVVAGLRHAHIVQIYDFGIEDNHYYMVMEFIEGHDLKKHLYDLQATGQTLSWKETLRIATCVADALDYAHQKEMIHRDIKPANILLTNDGEVFLADFGLVKLLDRTDLTEAGGVLGTPAYMAPEQLFGQDQDIDHLVDIYALGGVVYEMITGRLPFEKVDFPLGLLNADPPSPGSHIPDLPEAASQIILEALAKDPAKRPPSASQFIDELRQALDK